MLSKTWAVRSLLPAGQNPTAQRFSDAGGCGLGRTWRMGRPGRAAALGEAGRPEAWCRQKWRLSMANRVISAAKSHAGRVAMSQEKSSGPPRGGCGRPLPQHSGWHF